MSSTAISVSPISDSISSTSWRTLGGRYVGLVMSGDGTRRAGRPVRSAVRAVLPEAGRRQRLVLAALGTSQPCARVRAERWPMVAALLEDHEPATQRRRPAAALVIDGSRQREVPDRVVAVGIEPQRDDDHVARRRGDLVEALIER